MSFEFKTLPPKHVKGNSFITEILTKGKVLHEKIDSGMGAKSGGRFSRGQEVRTLTILDF